jgi:hypothetical protein
LPHKNRTKDLFPAFPCYLFTDLACIRRHIINPKGVATSAAERFPMTGHFAINCD